MKALAVVPYAGIALGAIAADQFVKRLVVDSMHLHERIEVLPFFSLFYTHNTGVAFSFLSGFDDRLMVAVTLAVTAFIVWLAWRTDPRQVAARLGFAFIIGGAAGNLIDRGVLGYVIDYVLLHAGTWSFAVFNLADAFITVGAMLVILQELIDWRRGPDTPQSH